jgi:hypothetical protein
MQQRHSGHARQELAAAATAGARTADTTYTQVYVASTHTWKCLRATCAWYSLGARAASVPFSWDPPNRGPCKGQSKEKLSCQPRLALTQSEMPDLSGISGCRYRRALAGCRVAAHWCTAGPSSLGQVCSAVRSGKSRAHPIDGCACSADGVALTG